MFALFRRFLMIVVMASVCASAKANDKPRSADAPLPEGTPQSVGLNPFFLKNFSEQIALKKKHKIHSVLVVRRGVLVFEEYYNGYTRDTVHDMRSATKSLTSLLTGIAIEQGSISSVDAPLMSFLSEDYPKIRDKGDLTLRHLLTMGTGRNKVSAIS